MQGKVFFVGFFLFFAHVSIWPPPTTHLVSKRQQLATPPTHLFAYVILEWSLKKHYSWEIFDFLHSFSVLFYVQRQNHCGHHHCALCHAAPAKPNSSETRSLP